MIIGVYLFLRSGLPIFYSSLDSEKSKINEILFAGVSSAINNFIKELADSDIESIQIQDGQLKYRVQEDIIFVIHTVGKETYESFLLEYIRTEFFRNYYQYLDKENLMFLDTTPFDTLSSSITSMNKKFQELYGVLRNVFRYLPPNVPSELIEKLLAESDSLLDGFPNDTIKLVRSLHKQFFNHKLRKEVMFCLGIYFGHEIKEKKFSNKIAISQSDILKILNEISIVKYDNNSKTFTFSICPICRGWESEENICDFFTGFIEGCFDNPMISIKEITCKAKNPKEKCTFLIEKQ